VSEKDYQKEARSVHSKKDFEARSAGIAETHDEKNIMNSHKNSEVGNGN